MAGVIPNFNTVNSGKAAPLSPGQKFHLFFKGAFDPYQFVLAGIDAGIGQAENENPGYGQGFEGYAKRYGANYADNFSGNFFGNAVLPTASPPGSPLLPPGPWIHPPSRPVFHLHDLPHLRR